MKNTVTLTPDRAGRPSPAARDVTTDDAGPAALEARDLTVNLGGREVLRVSLADHPRAATLPVRSVPAALAIGADGRLRGARAGRLGRPEIAEVVAAV